MMKKVTFRCRRVLSMLLALAMVLALVPSVALAADDNTVTVHYLNNSGWANVYGYVWNSTGSNNSWPGGKLTENADHSGWYDLTVTDTDGAFSCIFNSGSGSQTADIAVDHSDGTTEYWYVNGQLLKTAPDSWTTGETEAPPTITVHYQNSGWSKVYGYVWGSTGSNGSWPGEALSENADHSGWYDLVVIDTDGAFSCIFNNGSGSQTADISVSWTEETNEFWYAGNTLTSTAPDGWNGGEEQEPSDEYYLVGFINGADYGCNDDYANLGEYKFVDGKLTATFTADSYIFIKTGDNANWYMTAAYTTDTTATFANTSTGACEKMWVPGNTELNFTLTVNADGTLTLSYTTGSSEGDGAEGGEEEIPEGYTTVTIHFYKPESWGSTMYAYTWAGHDNGAWPGSTVRDTDGDGWYDLVVAQETPASFNFIFNDGGNQTADLATGTVTGDTELWVVENTVYTEQPKYTVTVHFQAPASWGDTINAYSWDDSYTLLLGAWPGTQVSENADNPGWYDATVERDTADSIGFIFNNGTYQTSDLVTGTLSFKTELWVTGELRDGHFAGELTTSAPAGWSDPNRTVHVPGTFPGPSWDAASNKMTWNEELGLYVYTFEDVPAANYEFKIALNGSWTENYGVGGYMDGSNYSVTVPETMDVTVYYSDVTHLAVTNVDYVFAEISLTIGNAWVADLTDPGLTGIYTATVELEAGTYSDAMLVYNTTDFVFTEFTLEQAKEVTFYMDPVTGIYYCNASDVPIDTASIYYDSQDTTYKATFGALAQDEACTFAIRTGTDVTSAVLVIKGVASFPMVESESGETGSLLWECEASVPFIGEYDYYFVLSNGYTITVYGDDDGYYGPGKCCELTDVIPYDLVVYTEGFETPDWMKNAVIYQIFPDRFYDGDESNNQAQLTARGEVDYEYVEDWYALPENPEQESMLDYDTYISTGAYYGDGQWSNEIYGGDLQGIIQRIDYLEALGVNVIYLNPVFSSISNHRYDACDYTEIDPILGDLGDFTELVEVAEAHGMHIILDGVFNHVSDDSVYFDRYYKFLGTSEKIGAYPYWAYVYDYMSENGADQETAEAAAVAYFTENYGITDYAYTEWFEVYQTTMEGAVDNIGLRAGKPVYAYDGWWGYDSMPIIYSTNGSEYQTGNWAKEIIYNEDGTSVTQYWISQGSNGWRLDVANEVSDETWQRFRDSVKALDSDAVIIGEIWDDATKYLLGDMYDSVMNYMFRNAVTGFAMGTNADTTTKEMEKLRERYPEEAFYAMMNLVGSHDTTRILSYLDGIGDDRTDKTLSGAFPTYETTSDLAKNRQYLVSFLQFTYAGAPTIYYGDEIGMVGSDDPDDRRAMEWGQGNQELVEWYATLAAIREEYSALRTGSVEAFTASDNVMGYVRRDDSDALVVVANNATSAKTVTLDLTVLDVAAEALTDLITGTVYAVENGKVTVTVDGLRGAILTVDAKEITINSEALAPAYDESCTVVRGQDADVTLGDINGDGEVGIDDASLVIRYYNEIITLTDEQLLAADVNGDGEIGIDDASLIVRYYNELIDAVPAEKT